MLQVAAAMPTRMAQKQSYISAFANYYNRERMHFGVLRVINDDSVEGGEGFGTHPHNDMEIISFSLEVSLNTATVWATEALSVKGTYRSCLREQE